ncbi:MAG: radical SAM protein [Candidatus Omnitrophota bacterium]
MCYAIPGKVEAISANVVTVDYFGEKKKAYNEFIEISVGDYIYAQGGYVITRVPPREAAESLAAWKELFFKLKEVDLKRSRFISSGKTRGSKVVPIFNKVNKGIALKHDELRYLLGLEDKQELATFFKAANFLRHKYHDNSCCVHGIIEISNNCRRNCLYCGISALNKNIPRYRMDKDEILACVAEAVEKYGFKALVLQSAEDDAYSVEELADIIKTIKQRHAVLIFVSFGEIGLDGLKKLYAAGSRGLLMRFETSNPEIYAQLHPGYDLQTRIEHLKSAYELGYLIITGSLIGLPGQSPDDIINDMALSRQLHAEMLSFGPFIPHPDTVLAASPLPKEEHILKVISLARFTAEENAKILVTTGFETLSDKAREKGLACGANSVMLNVTPLKYRPLYAIYPNRAHEQEPISLQIEQTIALLKSMGRAPTDLDKG